MSLTSRFQPVSLLGVRVGRLLKWGMSSQSVWIFFIEVIG